MHSASLLAESIFVLNSVNRSLVPSEGQELPARLPSQTTSTNLKKQTNTTSSKNQYWEKYSYIRKETNAMDDTTKYTLSFPSDNEMANSIGMRENGRIIAQCDGGKTNLY